MTTDDQASLTAAARTAIRQAEAGSHLRHTYEAALADLKANMDCRQVASERAAAILFDHVGTSAGEHIYLPSIDEVIELARFLLDITDENEHDAPSPEDILAAERQYGP